MQGAGDVAGSKAGTAAAAHEPDHWSELHDGLLVSCNSLYINQLKYKPAKIYTSRKY